MTTMQKIIDKLASKIHCKCSCCDDNPVYIGDVLERMLKEQSGDALSYNDKRDNQVISGKPRELIDLWGKCGFSKSLQEIEECGYEEVNMCGACEGTGEIYQEGYKTMCGHCQLAGMGIVQILKNPNAQALSEFINSII